MWMQYVGVINMLLWSFIIKPYLLIKDVEGYHYKDFIPCFFSCIKVLLLSTALSYMAFSVSGDKSIINSVLTFTLSFFSVLLSSFVFLDKYIRRKITGCLLSFVRKK